MAVAWTGERATEDGRGSRLRPVDLPAGDAPAPGAGAVVELVEAGQPATVEEQQLDVRRRDGVRTADQGAVLVGVDQHADAVRLYCSGDRLDAVTVSDPQQIGRRVVARVAGSGAHHSRQTRIV